MSNSSLEQKSKMEDLATQLAVIDAVLDPNILVALKDFIVSGGEPKVFPRGNG